MQREQATLRRDDHQNVISGISRSIFGVKLCRIMNFGWFSTLRSVLEITYFVSGIALTVAAIYGLKQLRLTKRIATQNAKRESIKFAAERCQYYAETCVNLQNAAWQSYRDHKLTCLNDSVFTIQNGQITDNNFDSQRVIRCQQELSVEPFKFVEFVNSLEAFAIPFVAGVADDELGFQETAAAFCSAIKQWMLFIFILRMQGNRFESCLRLYESWSARLEAEKLKPLVKSLSEKIKAAEKGKFPPLESS
jgi:hypothetical protein